MEVFRDSSLLTDLTLSTEDGLSFQVHSPVLAAVSSLVHHSLQDGDAEWEKRGGSVDGDTQREVSMVLGPGMDRVGLAGVLEFAYTGVIAALNTGNLVQIQTAAQVLGVPRVLELCREEEEKMKIGGQKKTEERKISAAEQMEISLQSIRQLWTQRVGCDVVLEVDETPFNGRYNFYSFTRVFCGTIITYVLPYNEDESKTNTIVFPPACSQSCPGSQ